MRKEAVLTILGVVVLVVWGLLIYSNTLLAPFQFDDGFFIIGNPAVHNFQNLPSLAQDETTRRRFVTFLTFALNYRFGKLNVLGYHLVNDLIHISTALLVWFFILRLFSLPVLAREPIARHKKLLSFLAALLFLVHPIQTQAVTYISQRFTCLATLFYVAAMCFYLKGREALRDWKERPLALIGYGAGFVITALLGVFTKEIILTLPFMLALVEYSFLREERAPMAQTAGGGVASGPGSSSGEQGRWRYFALAGIGLAFIFVLLGPSFQSLWKDVFFRDLPPGRYILTQFRVIVTYIRLLFVPVNQNADYDYPWAQSIFEGPVIFSFLFLAGIIFLCVKYASRYRLMTFGVVWFLIALAPESTIFPLPDVIMEHRMYLPSIGFFMALCCGGFYILRDPKKILAVFLAMALIFSYLTYQRNEVWRNRITFWKDAMKKSPRKSRVYLNLANAYTEVSDFSSAMENYNKAIQLDPDLAKAYFNKCSLLITLGNYDLALPACNRALIIKPFFAPAYFARGLIYKKQGKFDLALNDYRWALTHDPDLSSVYLSRVEIYLARRQYDLALFDIDQALAAKTNDAKAYDLRCFVDVQIGNNDMALEDCTKAIANNSEAAAAYFNRSLAFQAKNAFREALLDALKARSLGYQLPAAYLEYLTDLVKGSGPQNKNNP